MNFSKSSAKDSYVAHVRDNANALVLVKGLLKTDDWATYLTKVVASAGLVAGDWTFADGADGARTYTTNSKTGVDPGLSADGATDDIAIAAVDTVGQVIYLVQDVTDTDILNNDGDTLTIPGFNFSLPEFGATP